MIELRDYQKDLFSDTQAEFRKGKHRILVVSPCGSGKTILGATMAHASAENGNHTWFIVPRQEILEQTIDTFGMCEYPTDNIHIGMTITTANHMDELPKPNLIIFDECHLSVADTYWKIVNENPQAFIIGLTASPCRSDNRPLGSLYESMVERVNVRYLIEHKKLAPYEYYSVSVSDITDGLTEEEATEALMKPAVYGKIIESWRKFADGLQTVVYCTGVEHSKQMAKMFLDEGIPSAHFDGTTPPDERKKIVEDFRSGKIRVLCNCDIISMGFDMPDIGCVLMARPTQSASLYIQQSGRALRYKPNKTAVIIDAVGNYTRFNLPDVPYEWSLEEGIKLPKRFNIEGDYTLRTCPVCYRVFPTMNVCPFCGAVYPASKREIAMHEEIELKRIEKEEAERLERERKKARREQGMARTFEELVEIGKRKGYKSPVYWARMVMNGRKR